MNRKRPSRPEPLSEREFIDISSNSFAPPPKSIRDHRDFEEYRPLRRTSGGPESHRNTGGSARKPTRRERKPVRPSGPRKLTLALLVLAMSGITALLCIFLLFKISSIEITGDKVYDDAHILSVCGCSTGDNLFFLSTADKEEKLREELPYIGAVKLIRHFPSKLEIHITGAQVVSCVSSGGAWLYVSGNGKILERKNNPKPGVMQVAGLDSLNVDPGLSLSTTEENQGKLKAYEEIAAKLVELDAAGKFSKLDLTDPYDIRLWYEDRVELKLGSAASLAYKVEFGCTILSEKIGAQDSGTLDLSYAEEVKRASFTSEAEKSPSSQGGSSSVPEGDSSSGGRGEGIPNAPYTGESSESSSEDNGGDDPAGLEDGGNEENAQAEDGTTEDTGEYGDWDEGGYAEDGDSTEGGDLWEEDAAADGGQEEGDAWGDTG